MLDNVFWYALNTEHARFAVSAPAARKYPAAVAPFAGIAYNSADSLTQLRGLLAPGETVYLMGDTPPTMPGLNAGESVPGVQMTASNVPRQTHSEPQPDPLIAQLTAQDADAMVELTNLAFPGFFRVRTCEMGAYFGVRLDGGLVAMAGERLAIPHYREISGVCTHPAHTGKGYASRLITHLMQEHAAAGLRSFLHAKSADQRAIALYTRLGFCIRREVTFHPLSRSVRF
jgi:ribosomal protein S18 acetylase RimI-like enzyme